MEESYHDKIERLYELRTKFDEIKKAFEAEDAVLMTEIFDLECEIKVAVLSEKMTLYGGNLIAVYNKGRMTWDGKALNRMSEKYPEILNCAKYGDSTVSFRKAARKELNAVNE